METTHAAQPLKTRATCPKCDGNGSIAAFAGIAGGVCFECEGRRYILVDALSPSEAVANECARIEYDINDTLALVATRPDLVKHRAERIARDMFKVGSTLARHLLAQTCTGVWFDEVGQRRQADRALARKLADDIVAAGRRSERGTLKPSP